MFYFLNRDYTPNTAATNRNLAYLKYLSEERIRTIAIFWYPDEKCSKVDERLYPNVEFVYLWEKYHLPHNKLLGLIWFHLISALFCFRLKKGDKVYMYNLEEVLHKVVCKKGVEVYHERTEHPEVVGVGNHFWVVSLRQYLKDCVKLNGLFVISQALKKYYVSHGVPESKIHIINMFVDSSRFEGVTKQSLKEQYIAYCGVMYNNKDGVDSLINAFSKISKINNQIKLYLIGSIPKQFDNAENMKLIEKLGLANRVVMTGSVSATKMPQMLINATIVALARPNNLRAEFGFPTKLGEYLLSGNPAVVTNVGDISLFLEDGINALISSSNDPEIFAQKLQWVLENPVEAKVIGGRGKEVALNYFNSKIESKKIINYMSLDQYCHS